MARIFISPLEWGTGHATRLIPIIRSLKKSNNNEIIIGTNKYERLYKYLFPDIEIVKVPKFDIIYRKKTLLSVISYLPRFIKFIRKDKKFINDFLIKNKLDIIISDNRYGMYHSDTYNVIITHQLNIILNGFSRLFSFIVRYRIKKYIAKFDECWVPDIGNIKINLTGSYSYHKTFRNSNIKYVGILSQFDDETILPSAGEEINLLVMLSGPENHRTLLENIIIDNLVKYNIEATIVRGVKGKDTPVYMDKITLYDFVYAEKYVELIKKAKYIICRAGYTSIMDLIILNKKALLIPTPDHPEQEFLAKRLYKLGYFPYMTQKEFNLKKALEVLNNFNFTNIPAILREKKYEYHIRELCEKIGK